MPICASEAAAQTLKTYHFDVSVQPLEAGVLEVAAQGRVAISMPPAGLRNARGNAVAGDMTVDQALDRLLAGTGYAARRAGPDAYIVAKIQPASSQPVQPADQNEDVVVVSARIEAPEAEMARDVTVVGAEQLLDFGAAGDGDLAGYVAGLSFTNMGEGRDKILLRGVSDGALAARTQSLVGLYLDDTRLTYGAPDPDLQLVDMKSVEVLRGPQGALYGAGAMGGIVRLVTNPTDLEVFEGSALAEADTTRGGGRGSNFEAIANVPIIPAQAAVRVAYWRQIVGGWLDNRVTGQEDTNRTARTGWRLAGTWQATPDWSISATGVSQSINSDDSQYVPASGAADQRQALIAEPHDNDFNMANITVRGRTDWGDLVSSTSKINHAYDNRYDLTGAPASTSSSPQGADEADSLHITVHESRLTSPAPDHPWFVGVFYADGDSTHETLMRPFSGAQPGQPFYSEERNDKIDEIALFGEIGWKLFDEVTLSTGARYFHSTLTTDASTFAPTSQDLFHGHLQETGFAPDVRLSWQPAQGVLFYVSAARGYRPAGFNSGGPSALPPSLTMQPFRRYSGDEIWTYEVGSRLSLFEDRLALHVTAFNSDWRGVQTDTLIANGFPYTGNVGNARATGVEVETRYAPTEELTFRLNALINEPEIVQPDSTFPLSTTGGLPGSPELSIDASVRYERAVDFGTLNAKVFAELQASHDGRSSVTFGSKPVLGGYTDANASIGLQLDRWRVSAFGRNITASDGWTYSYGNPYQPPGTLVTPIRPPTYGISIKREF